MNQVANEIRIAKERAVKRDLLEQYISIKRSVMRDQLELDRLLAEEEGLKERKCRCSERRTTHKMKLHVEATRSEDEIESNAELSLVLENELKEIEAEETKIEEDSETLDH